MSLAKVTDSDFKKKPAGKRQIRTAIGTTPKQRLPYLFREVNLGEFLSPDHAIAHKRDLIEIYGGKAALVNDEALGRIYPHNETHYRLVPLDKTIKSPPPQPYSGLSKLLVQKN